MKETILITGGMGFIGSRIAHKLMNDYDIIIVDNLSYGNIDNAIIDGDNILEKCMFFEEDASNKDFMYSLFNKYKIDYVYHIAGIAPLPDCQMNKYECFDSNVKATLVVLDCCQRFGIKRLMFSSSNSLYENIDEKDFPLNEKMHIETTLFYPTSKLISEELCKSFNRTYNLPITVFRFANVYGEGMDILRKYPPVTGAFIKALYYNNTPVIYNEGKQHRDFIYIDDLVSLVIKPLKEAKTIFEIINVGTNETHSINEQLSIIAKYMNKSNNATFIKGDDFWKKMPEIYEGEYVIDDNVLNKEVNKCTLMSYDYAKEVYNWKPKYSFEEGLKRTVDKMITYLKENEK